MFCKIVDITIITTIVIVIIIIIMMMIFICSYIIILMINITIYEQIQKACGANYFYFGKFDYCVAEVQFRIYAKRKTSG